MSEANVSLSFAFDTEKVMEELKARAAEVERLQLNFTIKMRWLAVQMRRQLAAINAREGVARSDPFAHRRVATKGRRR